MMTEGRRLRGGNLQRGVRPDPDQVEKLDVLAKQKRMNRTVAIVQLVELGLTEHERRERLIRAAS